MQPHHQDEIETGGDPAVDHSVCGG